MEDSTSVLVSFHINFKQGSNATDGQNLIYNKGSLKIKYTNENVYTDKKTLPVGYVRVGGHLAVIEGLPTEQENTDKTDTT